MNMPKIQSRRVLGFLIRVRFLITVVPCIELLTDSGSDKQTVINFQDLSLGVNHELKNVVEITYLRRNVLEISLQIISVL